MNFNNSRLVDDKPMKFGTFVPYMYRFVIIVKYLTNFFKLEWNLGIKFTLRFFFLSVYKFCHNKTVNRCHNKVIREKTVTQSGGDRFFHLCWGLTTRQPLRVILCRLPEKWRKEMIEEMKGRDREERRTGVKVKKQKK